MRRSVPSASIRYRWLRCRREAFVRRHHDCHGLLFRVYKDGKVSTEAFLDDYALLAEAFINLYEVTFDLHWLNLGQLMTEHVWDHFADHDVGY